jgi:hypothetical protein
MVAPLRSARWGDSWQHQESAEVVLRLDLDGETQSFAQESAEPGHVIGQHGDTSSCISPSGGT